MALTYIIKFSYYKERGFQSSLPDWIDDIHDSLGDDIQSASPQYS